MPFSDGTFKVFASALVNFKIRVTESALFHGVLGSALPLMRD
jgi:hypothetical protein